MFLDRVEQTKFINNSLNLKKSIFLYSQHGIGKTALCNNLIQNNTNIIKVEHRNKIELFDEGDIVVKLYEELDRRAEEFQIDSYDSFLKRHKLKDSLTAALHYIDDFKFRLVVPYNKLVLIATPVILVLKWLLKLFVSRKKRETWAPYQSSKTELLKYYKYIDEILKNNSDLIINVNNIQVIDKTSFDFIVNTIKKYNTRFVLEYSEETDDGRTFFDNNFNGIKTQIQLLQLDYLPEPEVNKLIEEYGLNKNRAQIIKDFKKSGNLNHIIPTYYELNDVSISAHEECVIYLLELFNYKMKSTQLQSLFREITDLDKNTTQHILSKMAKNNIIFVTKKDIRLKDINANIQVKASIKATIFGILQQKYLKSDDINILEAMLPLFLEYAPQLLINYLPRLRDLFLLRADKDSAKQFIMKYVERISEMDRISDEGILYIIDIYYSMALFEEALTFLNNHKRETSIFKLYEAMLLNRLDQHYKSNVLLESILDTLSEREKLVALNIQLINYASLRDSKLMHDTYKNALKIKGVKKIYEYQFLLRNSHLVLNRKSAIKNIKKCIKFFKAKNDSINISRSLISLSIIYILEEKLNNAKKLLQKANKFAKLQAYELSVSYNNLATIYMQKGLYGEAERYLYDACKLCFDLFDKLSILGNLLTIKTNIKDIIEGENITSDILNDLAFEPDKKLKSCIYNELARFKEVRGDKKASEYYYELSEKMLNEISINRKTTNQAVTVSQGYIINQLAFWHFDLYQLISNS